MLRKPLKTITFKGSKMLYFTQITQLVAELLYKHDCVIIPNFGGFVARQYSAGFSKGNNLLYPPNKHVLFNKNLVHNDGLLSTALMERNLLTVSEADKQIQDYKAYIQSLLQAKKRFELENIGLLYIDTESNLRFEAKSNINFLLDAFGLEPVMTSELVIEPEKPIVTPQFEDRKPVIEPVVTVRKKSYTKMVAFSLAIPFFLLLLFVAVQLQPLKPIIESSVNPFYSPDKTYIPHIIKQESIVFINESKPEGLIVDANGYATFKLAENGKVIIANTNETNAIIKTNNYLGHTSQNFAGKFQVVLGCFGVESNAKRLVKELNKKQIQAGISGVNQKGLHVVSCGGFNSKEDANSMLATVKGDYPNAWIMAQ